MTNAPDPFEAATARARPPDGGNAPLSPDARILLFTRGLRGFADGAVSVLLAGYLLRLGFSAFEVGVVVTTTLLGSALLTLYVGLSAHPRSRRHVLLAASGLMLATGLGFLGVTSFWPLLLVAAVGTLNPSAGDVSVFLPVEQAALSETVPARGLTRAFAYYSVSGGVAGALGALASGIPARLAEAREPTPLSTEHLAFLLYAAVAVCCAAAYARLSSSVEPARRPGARAPLVEARGVVLRLSALFALDAFGGGFVVQSMLALWLARRFQLTPEATGILFFVSGLLSAGSQLLSPALAARFGRIRTMVFTHLPANVFLVLAGLTPIPSLAITLLLIRAALSQMDVPARQSYVMSVVPPHERAAAASVTNVPRSLASALSPALAGWMMSRSSIGWPLVAAGAIKIAYDLLLLAQFRKLESADPGLD